MRGPADRGSEESRIRSSESNNQNFGRTNANVDNYRPGFGNKGRSQKKPSAAKKP